MMLRALTDLSTPDLEKLLRSVHRGDLACPFDVPGLTRVGLQYLADRLDHLRGLDARAVTAVLVAVIAERRAAERRRPRLV
jgi:hypothetical protein